jgi:hypothetical protein
MDLALLAISTIVAIVAAAIITSLYLLVEKLVKNRRKIKGKHIAILGISLLVLASGYWFAARPYFATRDCKDVALSATGYTNENSQGWLSNKNVQTKYAFVYGVCMQKEGINP